MRIMGFATKHESKCGDAQSASAATRWYQIICLSCADALKVKVQSGGQSCRSKNINVAKVKQEEEEMKKCIFKAYR